MALLRHLRCPAPFRAGATRPPTADVSGDRHGSSDAERDKSNERLRYFLRARPDDQLQFLGANRDWRHRPDDV